jgi:beta-glucanase (GH16 family)
MWQTHLSLNEILEELKGKGLSHGCIYQYAFKPTSGSSNIQSELVLNVIKITVSTDRTGYNLILSNQAPYPHMLLRIINKRTQDI